MALLGPETHQLDRLGRELKCPICLSLFKQAASLSCNHTFCTSCILQSMKSNPACPICKVHTTRREVRAAPQMDNLVAIYVSMGSAAGLDIMASQLASDSMEPVHATTTKNKIVKSRNALSNITNSEKKSQIKSKGALKSPEHRFKGFIPPKKRVQVPQPSSLKGEFGLNKDDIQVTPKSHTYDTFGFTAVSDATTPSSRRDHKEKNASLNVPAAAGTQFSKGRKTYRRAKDSELLAVPLCSTRVSNAISENEKQTPKEAATLAEISLSNCQKARRRKGRDSKPFNLPLACSPHATKAEMDSNRTASSGLPERDDTSRRKLDPFFWLRDESSQDTDTAQVAQPMLIQSTVQPNFSDLKDSDDDLSLDINNEEVTKGGGIGGADSYDSDDFDWTQQPCSPELKCSPAKDQGVYKDIVIDLSLEAAQPATEDLLPNNQDAYKRPSQDKSSAKSLLESAREVVSIAKKPLNAALKENKQRRKSGRVKAQSESNGEIELPVRNATLGWQHGLVGCSSHHQTAPNKPSFNIILPGETKRTETISSCKRKAEDSDRLPKRKKISKKGEPEGPKGDKVASLDFGKDKGASETHQLVCIFCRTSEDSQVTGPMMHYNQSGVPMAGPKSNAQIVHVHRHCAEWAPDVYFVDNVAKNLTAEAARGLKIKCSSCGKKGAALGCCLKRCRRSYHYPCARGLSCKWEEDKFIMLCPEHATENFPVKRQRKASPRAVHNPSNEHQAHLAIHTRNNPEVENGGKTSTKWQCGIASKWVLCGSALDTAGKEQLDAFARLTGATVTKAWNSNVTHVIAGTDQHGAARRTLKFLMAILEGKWIVKLDWLTACTGAGKPISEEPFEINTDIHGVDEGPKQGRLLAAGKAPKLFKALQFYFMPDFLASYKGDLNALVVAGGGGVLHRKPVVSVADAEQKSTIVVYNNEAPKSIDSKVDVAKIMNKRKAEARELGTLVGAYAVPHHWILDSIASSKVHPLE